MGFGTDRVTASTVGSGADGGGARDGRFAGPVLPCTWEFQTSSEARSQVYAGTVVSSRWLRLYGWQQSAALGCPDGGNRRELEHA